MDDALTALQALAAHARSCIGTGVKLNEADTKAILVEPLLELLGWDTRNPAEVSREWRRIPKSEPVDYVLKCNAENHLLLEAKALQDPLRSDKGWQQVVSNATAAGFQWCARTNGHKLILVNLLHKAALSDKVFWEVDIADLDTPGSPTAAEALGHLRLISREAMVAGETLRAWEAAQAETRVSSAVAEMMAAPPDDLIEIVRRIAGDAALPRDAIVRHLSGAPATKARAHPKRASAPPPARAHNDAALDPGPRRSRRTGVADLVAAGLVRVGDTWRLRNKGRTFEARVLDGGALSVGGKVYGSPSAAAQAVLGWPSADGWRHWKCQDAAGLWRPAGELRSSSGAEQAAPTAKDAASDPLDLDVRFGDRATAKTAFEAMAAAARSFGPDVIIGGNSKHIVLRRRSAFAAIRVTRAGLAVGLRLPVEEAERHMRLAAQPRGVFEGWDALHVSVRIREQSEVDAELISLLRQAYDAAG